MGVSVCVSICLSLGHTPTEWLGTGGDHQLKPETEKEPARVPSWRSSPALYPPLRFAFSVFAL